MRILVDAHVFDGKYQGTRTYLQGIYSELIKYKDIQYYFAAKNYRYLQTIFGTAPNVHYIQLKSTNSVVRLSLEYPKIIERFKINYAHFQYISPLIKTCKEIITIHDLLFLDYPQYFPLSYRIKNHILFRKSANRADILLTVSDYSKNEIAHYFKIPKDKIYITPNGVLKQDKTLVLPDIRKKWNLEKYILSVGRIEPRKNFHSLLKAFIELELYKDGYKLVLIGSPDLKYDEFYNYYNLLSPSIKESIIMDTATFEELISLYKNATLFVFPSLAEGFGIPPIEAIEYGCPLLCSNATAMAEFNLPDECQFDPLNINELKKKIKLGLNQKELLDSAKIQELFNWEKSAKIIYTILKKDFNLSV